MTLQPARAVASSVGPSRPDHSPSPHHLPLGPRLMLKILLQCCSLLLEATSCASCTQALECTADPLRQGAAAGAPPALSSHARECESDRRKKSSCFHKTRRGKATKQGERRRWRLSASRQPVVVGGRLRFPPHGMTHDYPDRRRHVSPQRTGEHLSSRLETCIAMRCAALQNSVNLSCIHST